jgi:hypothetical protein
MISKHTKVDVSLPKLILNSHSYENFSLGFHPELDLT